MADTIRLSGQLDATACPDYGAGISDGAGTGATAVRLASKTGQPPLEGKAAA